MSHHALISFNEIVERLTLWVRQSAWLNTIPSKAKRPRRETKSNAMPSLIGGAYLIEILFEVGPAKPMGMGGSIGIDEIDLAAWMSNQNVQLTPWEAQTVRRLSHEYAAMLSASSEPNTPAPWSDAKMLTDEMREKISNAMSDWSNRINTKTR